MEQNLLQKIAKFIKEHQKKKQWQMAVTVLAALVVFVTTYSLILPAITMTNNTQTSSNAYTASNSSKNHSGSSKRATSSNAETATDSNANMATSSNAVKYYCGFEGHTHEPGCYDSEGQLSCGLEVHVHTDACLVENVLTEGELALVQRVIELIDSLPTSEEAKDALAAFEEAGDKDGYEAYVEDVAETAWEAYESYEAMKDAQKALITNIERLNDLKWLWKSVVIFHYPELTDDEVYVSKLKEIGSKVLEGSGALLEKEMTACSGNEIEYQFELNMDSYEDGVYSEGRLKVEIVLPFEEDAAEFDLDEMSWLDDSEGYEAVITEETRTIGGEEISCQVLTGYKLFKAKKADEKVIPGQFTGNVVVSVNKMKHNEKVSVLISAAMENNEWNGECAEHGREEIITIKTSKYSVYAPLSPEEQKVIYEGFLKEVEETEIKGLWTDELRTEAEELLKRIETAYSNGELSDEYYQELSDRMYALLNAEFNTDNIAEMVLGTNWMRLRDSGWFEEYSEYEDYEPEAESETNGNLARMAARRALSRVSVNAPSTEQIDNRGGSNQSSDGRVSVSKTIAGTDLENIFDITLTVTTNTNIKELYTDPDMAVVIVMDISNTMNEDFGNGTKYQAAMESAEAFIDLFYKNNDGRSKIGYVAFNTSGHKICAMQTCSTEQQAGAFKNVMRTGTGKIINNYAASGDPTRYTNMEAGLKLAKAMLDETTNRNKYVIFLSDGLPTTYVKNGYEYEGYTPLSSSGTKGKDGVFWDNIYNRYVLYGTNYSDKGAEKAATAAKKLKDNGVKIFSIGAGLNSFSGVADDGKTEVKGLTGTQLILNQLNRAYRHRVSTIDTMRTNGSEMNIGSLSDPKVFEKWLGDTIGSGYDEKNASKNYYFDTTDAQGLLEAYKGIFAKIKSLNEESSQADWVAVDPMPIEGSGESAYNVVEFIQFYDKNSELAGNSLTGSNGVGEENTASFDTGKNEFSWNLKKSGYTSSTTGSVTTYTYEIKYRVRLKNENDSFAEGTIYKTNNPTSLTYRVVETQGNNSTISDPRKINFPIPSVHGYLGELSFKKVDSFGNPVVGAEFTLAHDTANCTICRGDETSVNITNTIFADKQSVVAVSGTDGMVSFTKIPSGHQYTLVETKVPDGYMPTGNQYQVTVAYDEVTVSVTDADGKPLEWTGNIVNHTSYALPQTGGIGTRPFIFSGITMILSAAGYVLLSKKKSWRKEEKS